VYLRNLGTDEPLTSMNGMARGRATSSLSQNRQNQRNRECCRPGQALAQDPAPILVTGLLVIVVVGVVHEGRTQRPDGHAAQDGGGRVGRR
jgi:hypothetical protein